ncbi:hypothetical protein TSUD_03920 [Trifolium subterraneum]|nr:hypothetical protein TSUD_03920 [Trifolium subterraneum]
MRHKGKETSANSISWAILLLGMNQEWQNKAREEVLAVLGHHTPPTPETISGLKLVALRSLIKSLSCPPTFRRYGSVFSSVSKSGEGCE